MKVMRTVIPILWLAPVALFLSGGSDTPKTESPKEPPKPLPALTGRQAFQQMYPQARGWSPDALPLEIRSLNLAHAKNEPGKAGVWQVIFVSASRRKAKTYTYSVTEEEGNLHQGVYGGIEEDYTPRPPQSSFEIAAIKVDSDEAYKTAAEKSAD